ncbi:unnamed protein product [Paramecium octaurelia]|uniref:Uncharacterized protein n=1 Tax=Paramecium octaurelia TaxID=43137 RepID=A0A8S1VY42_PAROT|nr:unnamed protein product [Paramecium octaurelia]
MITDGFLKYQQMTLWHSVFVNLNCNQISFKQNFLAHAIDMNILSNILSNNFATYYFRYNMEIQYNHFRFIWIFKLEIIFIIIVNNKYNCEIAIFSCQDCHAPTNNDCSSCSEASHRIYIPGHKALFCPYSYLDDQINQNCLSFSDQLFDIEDLQKTNDCQNGYFQYDNSCYPCPSSISNRRVICIEYIQNIKGWKDYPVCIHNIYMDPNGSPAKIFYEYYDQFIFDGKEPFCVEIAIQILYFQL